MSQCTAQTLIPNQDDKRGIKINEVNLINKLNRKLTKYAFKGLQKIEIDL